MNAKLSQHMTLLGLCAMVFYGVMLGMGQLSIDVLPQFVVSAVIFLSSGRIMRKAARALPRQEQEEDSDATPRRKRIETDWPWMTQLLNWTAAMLIVGVMAVFIMMPPGASLRDAVKHSAAPENYFAGAVP